jgi:guanine deaminase
MLTLAQRPPFALRARLLSPLSDGSTRHEPDAVVEVAADGTLARVAPWSDADAPASFVDLRPFVLMPGMVDMHVHLPQVPSAGMGAGQDLLAWLEGRIFPLERGYDRERAEQEVPTVLDAIAGAGTTTIVAYAALWHASTDAAFAAAERHGMRAVIGKVMMDRGSYDSAIRPADILERSLRESDDLASRWHGRDGGRLQYAFTPRFAVSCSPDMLRESAALAASHDAYWQTHLAEDPREIQAVRDAFPEARDYVDVYDRAGALGSRTILAHAIHLSADEVARLVAARAAVAHCPASNLFLASGMMPLARYLAAGMHVALGSDVAAGPELSMFTVMRAGAMTQRALASVDPASGDGILGPLDWLRVATLDAGRALGMGARIGSLEVGKDADMIAVDARMTAPLTSGVVPSDPADLMSRLIFRPHPTMVRAAWVRGRSLEGPRGVDVIG